MPTRVVSGLCAGALAFAGPCLAGSLQIGPISVTMIGKERTATVTVRDMDSSPSNIQIRAMDWSQPDGNDVYTPSTTLVVSPPMDTLNPGQAQTVRLVIEGVGDPTTERAFRLVLDEIPNRAAPGGAGVQTAIRAMVPVFLSPSLGARPKLRWTAARSPAGLMLTAFNDGDVHERVLGLKAAADGQPIVVQPGASGYVLGHSKRTWTLTGAPATSQTITASGDGAYGAIQVHVPISP
jgi:fimbrial chaperone protein